MLSRLARAADGDYICHNDYMYVGDIRSNQAVGHPPLHHTTKSDFDEIPRTPRQILANTGTDGRVEIIFWRHCGVTWGSLSESLCISHQETLATFILEYWQRREACYQRPKWYCV